MTLREDLAKKLLIDEMVAEGMVEHQADVLVHRGLMGGQFMVEVKIHDVTEEGESYAVHIL